MDTSQSMNIINGKVFQGSRNQELCDRLCPMYLGTNVENTCDMGLLKLSRINKIQVSISMCL
jgi:hypothetical protein